MHSCLGHPSFKTLKCLISAESLPLSNSSFSHCNSCLCNKSHKLPFGVSSISCDKPLEILYTDVWGPALAESFDPFSYYVVFVDYYTKYSWLYLLKHKYEVTLIFENFRNVVQNFFNTKIKTVYSDEGGEYQGLVSTLNKHSIQHLKSPPHTPELIGTPNDATVILLKLG